MQLITRRAHIKLVPLSILNLFPPAVQALTLPKSFIQISDPFLGAVTTNFLNFIAEINSAINFHDIFLVRAL